MGIWERFKRVRIESCLQIDVVLGDEMKAARIGITSESTNIGLFASRADRLNRLAMMASESFDVNGVAESRLTNISIAPVFAIAALFLNIRK